MRIETELEELQGQIRELEDLVRGLQSGDGGGFGGFDNPVIVGGGFLIAKPDVADYPANTLLYEHYGVWWFVNKLSLHDVQWTRILI